MQNFPLMINGEPVETPQHSEVINPATGLPFASCSQADVHVAQQAIGAAAQAFDSWSKLSHSQRQEYCHQIGAVIEANMPELMQLICQETGKPMGGLNGVGAGMEVGGSAFWAHFTADLELPVEVLQDDDSGRVELHRKPLGVVASITPWNWPLLIATWHVIPALLAGNTVVIKPSPYTPITTLRMVELANSVLPPGVLNAITGDGEVGNLLTSHPQIAKVIFTGSTPTGRKIMASASASLKRLTLELGGNDAGIVLPGTNLDSALPAIFGCCFHNNGQTCAALKRLYVHRSQYQAACDGMAAKARTIKVGNGLEEGTELGPVQNAAQLAIVESLVAAAKEEGGKVLCGGERLPGDGYFYAPTVVAGLSNGSRLVDEEPFGPVLPIVAYDSLEEVIELANDNDAGLGGSVWADDLDDAHALAGKLACGTVWINDHGAVQPNMPFGGVKQSGLGVEFGLEGLKEMTSCQSICIKPLAPKPS
ncbi:aldehyde dehydrogenase family protein [Halioxenophilus aromaticivorans]|uniref:Aldehyde dehydrogenase family protein n=1 Tax=Halioxenophilus aromaticivorans TaxID=1306992 RepID=A0AAV3U5M3_9ALTE